MSYSTASVSEDDFTNLDDTEDTYTSDTNESNFSEIHKKINDNVTWKYKEKNEDKKKNRRKRKNKENTGNANNSEETLNSYSSNTSVSEDNLTNLDDTEYTDTSDTNESNFSDIHKKINDDVTWKHKEKKEEDKKKNRRKKKNKGNTGRHTANICSEETLNSCSNNTSANEDNFTNLNSETTYSSSYESIDVNIDNDITVKSNNKKRKRRGRKSKKKVGNTKNVHDFGFKEIVYIAPTQFWEKFSAALSTHDSWECNVTNIKLQKKDMGGQAVVFHFVCEKCSWTANVDAIPVDEKTVPLHECLVLGSIYTGIGYTQLVKLQAAIGIKSMSNKKYVKTVEEVCLELRKQLESEIIESGKAELRLAQEAGKVTPEGYGIVSVVADGSWMKRSLKNSNYNSPAGVGVIIGKRTGRILWIEVNDRYCSICDRAERRNHLPRRHNCFKNWSRKQSSTSMETEAIAEGFQNSVLQHKLIYGTLIGDGDSSVHARIQEIDPYGQYGISVKKIECAKHLRRCLSNAVTKISKKKGYIGVWRVIVEDSGRKIIQELNKLINYYEKNSKDKSMKDRITELRKSIKCLTRHVFGDHSRCSDHPLCKGPKGDEENIVDILEKWHFVADIEKAIERLILHAESLIYNFDTNLVESLNAIIAEKIGGKRINFAYRCSYHARVFAACLQFMCRNVLTNYFNGINKEISDTALKVEEKSFNEHCKRKERNNKTAKKKRKVWNKTKGCEDKDYGPNCKKQDMDEELYNMKLIEHKRKLEEMVRDREQILKETSDQDIDGKWGYYKRRLVTSTFFYRICHMRPYTSCNSVVKAIRNPVKLSSSTAVRWGLLNESKARDMLSAILNKKIFEHGLGLDPLNHGLAASTDGITDTGELVEIKCPYSARNDYFTEAYNNGVKAIEKLFTDQTCTEILESHEYYYQVQGQLNTNNVSLCYSMVWSTVDYRIIEIQKDEVFWEEKMKNKLVQFYETCLVPEIIDSRLARKMKAKDPLHIIQAKENLINAKLQKVAKTTIVNAKKGKTQLLAEDLPLKKKMTVCFEDCDSNVDFKLISNSCIEALNAHKFSNNRTRKKPNLLMTYVSDISTSSGEASCNIPKNVLNSTLGNAEMEKKNIQHLSTPKLSEVENNTISIEKCIIPSANIAETNSHENIRLDINVCGEDIVRSIRQHSKPKRFEDYVSDFSTSFEQNTSDLSSRYSTENCNTDVDLPNNKKQEQQLESNCKPVAPSILYATDNNNELEILESRLRKKPSWLQDYVSDVSTTSEESKNVKLVIANKNIIPLANMDETNNVENISLKLNVCDNDLLRSVRQHNKPKRFEDFVSDFSTSFEQNTSDLSSRYSTENCNTDVDFRNKKNQEQQSILDAAENTNKLEILESRLRKKPSWLQDYVSDLSTTSEEGKLENNAENYNYLKINLNKESISNEAVIQKVEQIRKNDTEETENNRSRKKPKRFNDYIM